MLLIVFVFSGVIKVAVEHLAQESPWLRRELRFRADPTDTLSPVSASAVYNLGRVVRRLMQITGIVLLITFRRLIPWRWAAHRAFRSRHRSRDFTFGVSLGLMIVAVYAAILVAAGQAVWGVRDPRALMKASVELAVLATLIAFAEEYAFRGMLFRSLMAESLGVWQAAALSSAIFALLHCFHGTVFVRPGWDPLVGVRLLREFFTDENGSSHHALRLLIGLILLGLTLAYLYLRTGALWSSIGLHAGLVFASKLMKKCVHRTAFVDERLFGNKEFIVSGAVAWLLTLALLAACARFGPRGALYRRLARR